MQQGLEDIAESSTTEQVAYLLVERARLLDEVEAEQTRSVSNMETTEGTMKADALYKLLQQEREDFEDELQIQRDKMREVKEKMKHTHEEEMSALMDENEKLQTLLDQTKRKVRQEVYVVTNTAKSLLQHKNITHC